jgi:hypothetical protein
MHKGGAALQACGALLRRFFLVIFLSVSVIGAMAEPFAEAVVTMDVEEIGERVAANGDGDGDGEIAAIILTDSASQPLNPYMMRLTHLVSDPYLRGLDFRFSARGPPV